jgi:translation initiation factor 1
MKKDDKTPNEKLTNNPFAALSKLKEALPEGRATPKDTAQIPSKTPSPKEKPPKRVVLRLERKGHGGKEMTRIEKLALPAAALQTWLKEIKQSLGCGGTVEGDDLLLQGDQRDRLKAFLATKNVQT